jgi:molecular chaperone DnaK (HSP70)
MVREAEENAEADKLVREKVEAKNLLESYLYGLRSTVEDSLKDKLSEGDKETLNKAIKDGLAWLEEHPAEEKEEYDNKRKEVEDVANPIIAKAYNAAMPPGTGGPGSESTSSAEDSAADGGDGPTVEEM